MDQPGGTTPPDPPTRERPGPAPPPDDEARTLARLVHLVGAVPVAGVFAAMLIWLVRKDDDPFVEAHAKEALNFQMTLAGFYFALFVLELISFGYLAVVVRPVMVLTWLASLGLIALAVRAVAAGRAARYPVALAILP